MAGHQSEFLKWSWRTSLPRALPWWSCAVFMLMTPTGMSPDLSFQPRLPSLTVYLTYPLTHPIHISNVTCSELNSWSFPPNLFHFHHSPSQDWVVILFVAQVNYFRVTLIFFSLSYSTSTLSGNLMHSVPKIYPVSHPFWSPPLSESSCHHHLSPGPGSSLLTGLPASTIVPCHLFSNLSDIILPCSLCSLPRILVPWRPIGCPVNLSCLCSDVTFSVRTSLTTLLKTAAYWPLQILLTLLYIFFLHGICHPLNTTYVTYYHVYCFTSFPQPGCQLLEGWVLIYYVHWCIPSA